MFSPCKRNGPPRSQAASYPTAQLCQGYQTVRYTFNGRKYVYVCMLRRRTINGRRAQVGQGERGAKCLEKLGLCHTGWPHLRPSGAGIARLTSQLRSAGV